MVGRRGICGNVPGVVVAVLLAAGAFAQPPPDEPAADTTPPETLIEEAYDFSRGAEEVAARLRDPRAVARGPGDLHRDGG
jgi:hypothetical protein